MWSPCVDCANDQGALTYLRRAYKSVELRLG
jgi:hypothetical protein